ncbi:MAG: DUF362 domain-containing protein [Anaerolineales bacterium]|nr:DUF362 domain-containing protein [Anaerolineales bacterium]
MRHRDHTGRESGKSGSFATSRRQFLKLGAAGLLAVAVPWPVAASPATTYRVGVGRSTDGYAAALRAISACADWSPGLVAGRTVLIKPNLVAAGTAESGVATDPQVVRAVVDLALAAGAVAVKIVEGYPGGNNFSACGYDFLQDYGGSGRVSLVDLNSQPSQLATVAGGLAYRQITMPDLVMAPDTCLISVAKLKTHAEALATLATKNVFGLPPVAPYKPPTENGRFAMHYRGLHQATVDINLARPIDFAVVDGIWGMEGYGPFSGNPVRMNTVVAGINSVAVDRVCLEAMQIDQPLAQHLTYAARLGLGPADIDSVQIRGDTLAPRAFSLPVFPPQVEYPRLDRPIFYPAGDQQTTASFTVSRPCVYRVDVVRTSETSQQVDQVRLLRNWTGTQAGSVVVSWDGRDNQGELVAPGVYTVRVEADAGQPARNAFATAWVEVVAQPVVRRIFLPMINR